MHFSLHRSQSKLFAVLGVIAVGIAIGLSPQGMRRCFAGVSHYLNFDVQQPGLYQDRFAVLVEAGTTSGIASRPESTNIRTYLLWTTLDKEGNKPKIVGPLSETPGPISTITNDAGIAFTDKDRSDLKQKPFLFFSPEADMVKSVVTDEGRKEERWLLKIGDKAANWIEKDVVDRPKLISSLSVNYLRSESGRFVVQRKDGEVQIYDSWLGKKLTDPWLEGVFADLCSRADLVNADRFLTDDLRYLSVFPYWRYKDYKEFTVDKTSFARHNHGVVYQRPDLHPRVFSGLRDPSPFVPFSCDAKLLFLSRSNERLTLSTIDGKAVYSQSYDQHQLWIDHNRIKKDGNVNKRPNYTHVSNDAVLHRIAFVCQTIRIYNDSNNEDDRIRILLWYYRDNVIKDYEIHMLDLFELRSDGYYPKHAIPVKQDEAKPG